jgi:transcription-repair coupling factor (superfamily II helicase)
VRWHDLGLLIVDEEQRFGVAQKERIKQLATGVDCLTLTATPIPRTLQFSLLGLRDISLIETPPEDRFPVQTYVVEWSEELVQEAIRREVGRGGQVFYVHNRIEDLDGVVLRLSHLVPEVRLAVAHGRMREEDLERTMIDFLEGEYDVLVATSIIESGLDMPRVNTLIVENADHLGLAQLYQLRGRVGRSNRLAYAYFTYQRDKVLTEVAEKRLAAIQQFTDFGAGFQIAMRDLEIRGAGNILGPEQHGFMVSVGLEMYRQLLEEAIQELRGQTKPKDETPPCSVEIALDAYIPASYMPDMRDKMDIYRRVAAATDPRTIDDLEEECLDRFGPLPPPVQNLLAVARIRTLGERAGVMFVREEVERTVLGISSLARVSGSGMAQLTDRLRGVVRLEASGSEILLIVRHPGQTAAQALDLVVQVLRTLAGVEEEEEPSALATQPAVGAAGEAAVAYARRTARRA